MKINEAIAILKRHNEWRRGADIPMTDVTILGEAIDCVVEYGEQPAFNFFKDGWESATDTASDWLTHHWGDAIKAVTIERFIEEFRKYMEK